MQRVSVCAAFAVVVAAGFAWFSASPRALPARTETDHPLTLANLADGRLRIVDLTWALNENNPYWPDDDYHPFMLRTIATLEEDGVLSKAFSMPEHLGTHIDAPNHFARDQLAVDKIVPANLFARGVMIDVTLQAEQNPDYQLTRADIDAWERRHGRIPDEAVVLLNTGWSRFWENFERYKNQDMRGRMHFPGFSEEAARFLVERRNIRGVGIDTLSIDPGLSQDFAVHHVVNSAGKYGLENLARLDDLPARGFYLFVAPIKIEEGSGGPTRVLAILPAE